MVAALGTHNRPTLTGMRLCRSHATRLFSTRDTAELAHALELRGGATIRAVELQIEPLEVCDVDIVVPITRCERPAALRLRGI